MAKINPEIYKINYKLCNKNSTPKTVKIFEYLLESFGEKIITGQQLHPFAVSHELDAIRQATGKQPAILGLDFMDYSPNRACFGAKSVDMQRAFEWARRGGLVTFCWHWNAPMHLTSLNSEVWHSGFYTEKSNFDIAYAMENEESAEYKAVLSDIDAISCLLAKLGRADIPILWRPLHEASGGWFWWGAKGADAYIKLYRLMYDRMTNFHSLNNLIWVWNGQHKDWYPGDDVVDIVGEDIYAGERVYSSQAERFEDAANFSGHNKIIALTETGIIPDIDACFDDGAVWSWYCPWYGGFVCEKTENARDFKYCEKHTELEIIKKMYNHSRAITLDTLPNFN